MVTGTDFKIYFRQIFGKLKRHPAVLRATQIQHPPLADSGSRIWFDIVGPLTVPSGGTR